MMTFAALVLSSALIANCGRHSCYVDPEIAFNPVEIAYNPKLAPMLPDDEPAFVPNPTTGTPETLGTWARPTIADAPAWLTAKQKFRRRMRTARTASSLPSCNPCVTNYGSRLVPSTANHRSSSFHHGRVALAAM